MIPRYTEKVSLKEKIYFSPCQLKLNNIKIIFKKNKIKNLTSRIITNRIFISG